jgi:hypothetical protein
MGFKNWRSALPIALENKPLHLHLQHPSDSIWLDFCFTMKTPVLTNSAKQNIVGVECAEVTEMTVIILSSFSSRLKTFP